MWKGIPKFKVPFDRFRTGEMVNKSKYRKWGKGGDGGGGI
jgi:hypothetical protein